MTVAGRRLLAVLLLAFVVLATLGPAPLPEFDGPLEGLPHFLAYAVATAAVVGAIGHGRSLDERTWWTYAAIVATVMVGLGLGLELGQRLVDRDVEVADALANGLGVASAVVAMWVARRAGAAPACRAGSATSRPRRDPP